MYLKPEDFERHQDSSDDDWMNAIAIPIIDGVLSSRFLIYNHDEREDMMQEAMIRCWRARSRLNGNNDFSYLTTVAISGILKVYNGNAKHENIRAALLKSMQE